MSSEPDEMVSECSLAIAIPAEVVWQTFRLSRAILQPDGIIEYATKDEVPQESPSPNAPPRDGGSTRIWVTEVNDVLMILRLEMSPASDVPWSSFQSQIRIEPAGP